MNLLSVQSQSLSNGQFVAISGRKYEVKQFNPEPDFEGKISFLAVPEGTGNLYGQRIRIEPGKSINVALSEERASIAECVGIFFFGAGFGWGAIIYTLTLIF